MLDTNDLQVQLEWQLIPRDGYKKCLTCKVWRERNEFYDRRRRRRVEKWPHCIGCSKARVNRERKIIVDGFSRTSHYNRSTFFRLSREEFSAIRVEQDDKCKCCGENLTWEKTKYAIDHCHRTGQIRGILCGRCNRTLGMVEDDIELLGKLITYLKQEA